MSAVFSGYLLSAGLNDNTRIDFQISFNPDWQIDDGFLKGQSWNAITYNDTEYLFQLGKRKGIFLVPDR